MTLVGAGGWWPGVQLWDGLRIEDDVFVGPNATFANDPFPRSKDHPEEFLKTTVSRGASIGANATILPGLTIGPNAMIGAGSVVTQTVPSHAIVRGNPVKISGYVNAKHSEAQTSASPDWRPEDVGVRQADVKGVTLRKLPLIKDLRGFLTVGEVPEHIPFSVRRYFLVFDVVSSEIRGEHAHVACHQLLVCLKGSVSVVAPARTQEQFELRRPDIALHVPPMIWSVQYLYSPDAILLVLASEPYDPADYIRDYDEFLRRWCTAP